MLAGWALWIVTQNAEKNEQARAEARAERVENQKEIRSLEGDLAAAIQQIEALGGQPAVQPPEAPGIRLVPVPGAEHAPKLTVLSIAPLLARAIREVFDDGSVTTLFGGLS